jgi:hypothetical protein
MRISRLLTSLLLASAASLHAQDLQLRMVMRTTIPGMSADMAMPASVMKMSYKGSKSRVDMQMAMPDGTHTSTVIIDRDAHKMLMLMHDDKQYMEQPYVDPAAKADSMMKSMKLGVPNIRDTKETRKFGTYEAKRFVVSMEMPTAMLGPMPGLKAEEPVYAIMEMWMSNDPTLAEAAKLMKSLSPVSAAGALDAYTPPGFPLRSTHVMVQIPKGTKLDPDAILKAGENAPGLVMTMTMEAEDIHVLNLDPSLFVVPKEYTKY